MNLFVKFAIFALFLGAFVLLATSCAHDPVYPPRNPYKIYRSPCATDPHKCNNERQNHEG